MTKILSSRQIEVLKLIQADVPSHAIGEQLRIGTRTVDSHRLSIYRNLGVKTAAGAVTAGLRLGLLVLNSSSLNARRLSPREIEILELVAEDMTSAEIGAVLDLRMSTVTKHYQGIYKRLGVRTLPGAVSKALSQGVFRL